MACSSANLTNPGNTFLLCALQKTHAEPRSPSRPIRPT